MPISIESDEWNESPSIDILEVEVERFLRKNPEKAYTVSEITDHLTDEKPTVFPEKLLTDERDADSSRLALVTSRLEKLVWHNRVEARSLDGQLYYTDDEDGWFPIAELERDIPSRFIGVEQEIEEIKERLDGLQMVLENHDQFPDEFDLQ
ncbi:hypothetical protein [Natronococcus occultus]|uniref:Uncharacterized protein n=1 Tax=Natronococcus occultus SP4 TaxID=694430 RepID=L0K0I7_9EURY|nr:hypothetical protein [Natronococcus occultus]AGB38787.1 hypothetical protein Natoc_3042 [Natronococcus occultus SP4]